MLHKDHHRLQKYSYTSETDWYVDYMWKNLLVIKICLMCYVLGWSLAEHLYSNRAETYYMSCVTYKPVFLQSFKSCLRTAVLKWWKTIPETWNMKSHYFMYQQMPVSYRPVIIYAPAPPTYWLQCHLSEMQIAHVALVGTTHSITALHVSVWYIFNYLQNKK
jgi:hypothetical protein